MKMTYTRAFSLATALCLLLGLALGCSSASTEQATSQTTQAAVGTSQTEQAVEQPPANDGTFTPPEGFTGGTPPQGFPGNFDGSNKPGGTPPDGFNGNFSGGTPPQGFNGNFSFPSGHTSNATVIFTSVYYLRFLPEKHKKWKPFIIAALLLWIVIAAFSRVRVGAHYLSDVLFGAAITFGIAAFFKPKNYDQH